MSNLKKTKRTRKNKSEKNKKLFGMIHSSVSKNDAIRKLFFEVPDNAFYRSLSNISAHPYFSNLFELNSRKDLSKIYTDNCPYTDLEKSLLYMLSVLEYNSEKISKFINYETFITENLLDGRFDDCIESLDAIDEEFGVSTWSISIRGSIYSIIEDLKAKYEFEEILNKKVGENKLFEVVAGEIGRRYQDPDIYVANMGSFVGQIFRAFDGELRDFLYYKLCPDDLFFNYNYEYITNYEKNSSLIDLFKCLISVLTKATVFEEFLTDHIRRIIVKLSKHINYPPLNSMANLCGVKNNWSFNEFDYGLLDLYTKGDYRSVVIKYEYSKEYFKEFQHFEILSKSATRYEPNNYDGLVGTIIKNLRSVVLKDKNYQTSMATLACLSHCFSSLRWFNELDYFIQSETKTKDFEKLKFYRRASIIHSGVNSPRKEDILPSDVVTSYKNSLKQHIEKSITVELYNNRNNIHDCNYEQFGEVDGNRFKKYVGKSLILNDRHEEAVNVLYTLNKCTDVLLSHEVSRFLVNSLIKINSIQEAVEEFVLRCIDNRNLIQNYNTDEICNAAISSLKNSNSIFFPIALSLHSRFVNNKHDSALRFSFENFLIKHNVKKPIDNIEIYERYDNRLMVYYLEHVCTPENMKLYRHLGSSRKIEECRIEVCNFLIEKGFGNKDPLVREVKERTKKLVVSKAFKQVENSKIYSDTSVFYSGSARTRIESLYDKYNELKNNDFSDYEDEQLLSKIVKLHEALSEIDINLYVIPPINEKNSTFFNLMQRVRDEFAFGEKGLNTYLSTRIRHGHLPTNLRKCLQAENLTTSRLSGSKQFKPNEYWCFRLSSKEEKSYKKLEKLFADFSERFESEVSKINDSWLQIFTLDRSLSNLADKSNTSESIFDYSMDIFEAFKLQARLPRQLSYDEFITRAIEWLWFRTDKCLERGRKRLTGVARSYFLELLNELQVSVYDIVQDEGKRRNFNEAVGRTKATMSTSLDQIISWFNRTDENVIANYEIETSIEIASQAIGVDVEFIKDKPYKMKGKTLSNFVDLFYIFIENAVSKSNLNKEELKITIEIKSVDNVAYFIIINNCIVEGSIFDANKRMEYYKNNYGSKEILKRRIQGEGNSGFFKVWNTLSRGLNLTNLIDMNYHEDGTFKVELRVFNLDEVIENEDIDS